MIKPRLGFLLCFILLSFSQLVKAQDNVRDLVKDLVEDLAKDFRKVTGNANLPKGCRIYVMPFRAVSNGTDTLRTRLGLEFQYELSRSLAEMSLNGKLEYKPEILSLQEGSLDLQEIQVRYLQPPATLAEESEFYKRILLSQKKPDYFFTGAFELDNVKSTLQLVKMRMERDRFNPDLHTPPMVFEDQTASFRPDLAIELKKLISPLIPPADAYIKLMQFQQGENSGGLRISMINAKTNALLRQGEKLKLGMGYQMKTEIPFDSYLFAFYYEFEGPLSLAFRRSRATPDCMFGRVSDPEFFTQFNCFPGMEHRRRDSVPAEIYKS